MSKCTDLLSALHRKGITLWLEGDRLHFRATRESLTLEETNTLRAMKDEVIDLLRQRRHAKSQVPPVTARRTVDEAPLTHQQFWLWQAIQGGSLSYLLATALRIRGALNHAVFRRSCEEVIRRNDSLRTRIITVDGIPTQRFEKPGEYALSMTDLSNVSARAIDTLVQNALHAISHMDCDLVREPLFQIRLLKLSDQEHVLLWSIHHIIADRLAMNLLFEELWRFYDEISAGECASTQSAAAQYADYSRWQHAIPQRDLQENQAYWQSRLDGAVGIRWPWQTSAEDEIPLGHRVSVSFGRAVSDRLRAIATHAGTTLGMAALTAYAVATSRMCEQRDFVVAITVSGRDRPELERMVGYCAYALYLRIQLATDETFASLLTKVSREFYQALSHRDFGTAVAHNPELHAHGLFQWAAWPSEEPLDGRASQLGKLALQAERFPAKLLLKKKHPFSQYHVMLVLSESDEGITGLLACSASAAPAIENFARHLRQTAEEMVQNPYDRVV